MCVGRASTWYRAVKARWLCCAVPRTVAGDSQPERFRVGARHATDIVVCCAVLGLVCPAVSLFCCGWLAQQSFRYAVEVLAGGRGMADGLVWPWLADITSILVLA